MAGSVFDLSPMEVFSLCSELLENKGDYMSLAKQYHEERLRKVKSNERQINNYVKQYEAFVKRYDGLKYSYEKAILQHINCSTSLNLKEKRSNSFVEGALGYTFGGPVTGMIAENAAKTRNAQLDAIEHERTQQAMKQEAESSLGLSNLKFDISRIESYLNEIPSLQEKREKVREEIAARAAQKQAEQQAQQLAKQQKEKNTVKALWIAFIVVVVYFIIIYLFA